MERIARHLSVTALLAILILAHSSLTHSTAESYEGPPSDPRLPTPPPTPTEPAPPPPTPTTVTSPTRKFKTHVLRVRVRPTPTTSTTRPPDPPGADVWAKLRTCESGGRYDADTGNGYFGAYQFHPQTWRNLGFPGLPHQAPPEMQDEAAHRLQARSGWGQWPACSRKVGAR